MVGPNVQNAANRKPPSSICQTLQNSLTQISHVRKQFPSNNRGGNLSNTANKHSKSFLRNPVNSSSQNYSTSDISNNANTLGVANAIRQKALKGDQTALASYIVHSMDNIVEHLDILEKRQNEVHVLLSRLMEKKNKVNKVVEPPECLPFRSTDELLAFDNVDTETYYNVIQYFVYLGGTNATDTAARYFKAAIDMNEELLLGITWLGSKKTNKIKLRNTRFAKACEEAIGLNQSIRTKPKYDEFVSVMIKALKSTKERLRRRRMDSEVERSGQRNSKEDIEYEPPRQRRRFEIKLKNQDGGNVDFIETIDNTDSFEVENQFVVYRNDSGENDSDEHDSDEHDSGEHLNEDHDYIRSNQEENEEELHE